METSNTVNIRSNGNNKREGFKKNNNNNGFDATSVKQLPTTSDELKYKHYFGEYLGYGVKIIDYEQGLDLYKHGSYGKGILSRSFPIFDNIKSTSTSGSGFHIKKKENKRSRDSNNIEDQLLVTKATPTNSANTITTTTMTTTSIAETKSINDINIEERTLKQQKTTHLESNDHIKIDENKSDREEKSSTREKVEYLQLSLCEAFYLIYSLGCLTILRRPKSSDKISKANNLDTNKKTMVKMTIQECWKEFQTIENSFVSKYIAYHYFRSLGWIPRSGIKYGCDYILYKLKPDLIHAQYGIIIQNRNEKSDNNLRETTGNRIIQSWDELSGINRVSESVAKGIIIFNIFKPKNHSAEIINRITESNSNNGDINNFNNRIYEQTKIECFDLETLSDYKVNMWELKRWIPNRTRA
ncbi:hypothetical protein RB653_006509 [Dictyostelium firmibasis]|uniref:tRNA-splicing endonuclease subunit Sen2 n=1 Tax=Dictyostelium firmibasis TaxID=79012 RepID=A0AAN7UBC9_9MYCE